MNNAAAHSLRVEPKRAHFEEARAAPRWRVSGLALLYGFGLLAVAGYAVYGSAPSRLAGLPAWGLALYAGSFRIFAQAHIAIAAVVLAVWLWRRLGVRWLGALGVVYVLSLASELLGTTYGVPFGAYAYDASLGLMWLDRVPVLVPLSWFLMALPSYALASAAGLKPVGRVLVGSLLLLAWDLALDPAMSHATRYWRWGDSGPFYGMPLSNLAGWYVTGLALMGGLEALRAERWVRRLPTGWLARYYGAVLLVPLGLCVAAGLWGAVAATVVVMVPLGLWLRRRTGTAMPASAAPVRV